MTNDVDQSLKGIAWAVTAAERTGQATSAQLTLFNRLRAVHATVDEVRSEVRRIHNAIVGAKLVDGVRTAEEDIRMQLREAIDLVGDLLYYLTPLEEHTDQPLTQLGNKSMEVSYGTGRI